MRKAVALVFIVLSVLAFGVATAATISVTVPSVKAETTCGGPDQPPCRCMVPNPPPYCN